ncbi:Uncharacterised protein [Providencia rustigianii]|uniref:Lipoprotein n=6 Tax=Providencia rustigianii TaxID=158850 RepID=D1P139_9GAMM|nr:MULTISPECIES: YbaY family lipoprotein [Providencia]EFB73058.1 hypothetical protein PROVRUST_05857 [Providencia rustigianii DSM 4541]MTC56853.1 hypothetical protein [Providencia rustigianii]SPY76064.1 Uncharacterised protein [Providencia rustigianii]SUC34034.1 Uncharacterised protein [Providencia rustigianii]VEB63054.1 Uncharacterised protein [Providencia rustigianii]
MPKFYISKNSLFLIFILVSSLFLLACNTPLNKSKNTFNLRGDIYSQSIDIPADALITLSVSSLNGTDYTEKSHYDYSFTTRKAGRTVNFSINLPEELLNQDRYFGLSVRVEVQGELLMMSNQIIPVIRNSSERLSLRVNAI